MLPLPTPVLPLCEIAEYWSRELNNLRHTEEVFDELLSSFWTDELHVTGSSGKNKVGRRAILKLINRCRVHPGFSLIERAEDRPALEQLPTGGIVVDLTNYVILPADEASWTDDIVNSAYVQMSNRFFDDFDDLIKPGFLALCTTREALSHYCKAMGYSLPRFWFDTNSERQSWNGRRERDAEAWFREISKNPKEKPRSRYLAEAQKQFPGMPEDAFDRIWTRHAPCNWRKPGPVVRVKKGRIEP